MTPVKLVPLLTMTCSVLACAVQLVRQHGRASERRQVCAGPPARPERAGWLAERA
jgi:hypothetical protein